MVKVALRYSTKQLKSFITAAETAWLHVFDSGKEIDGSDEWTDEGVPMALLPPRFQSKRSIYLYFRRWWSAQYARRMVCNMPFYIRNGKRYVKLYDPPVFDPTATELEILKQTDRVLWLRVRLGKKEDEDISEVVRYRLALTEAGRKMTITLRSGAAQDFRYQPCEGDRFAEEAHEE
ncbi:hypothetical protein [Paenibacillus sp. y28]|uniref:hypothetical protein n=1 Tax=Paenibacillus sp. y28 TaxID=3129110 RepID=UPI00301B5D9A